MSDVLRITDLQLRRGTRDILRGVSMSVARGEVVALMGASGSGKTTVLPFVVGLEAPDPPCNVDLGRGRIGAPHHEALDRRRKRFIGQDLGELGAGQDAGLALAQVRALDGTGAIVGEAQDRQSAAPMAPVAAENGKC